MDSKKLNRIRKKDINIESSRTTIEERLASNSFILYVHSRALHAREFMQLSNEFLPFRARQEARWWTETKS